MNQLSTLPGGIAFRVAVSRALLWVERAVPAFLPAALTVAAFFVLSLFGLWTALPGWLHLLLLITFAAGLLFAVGRAILGLRYPTAAEGIRRLERTNNALHRPVTTLVDPPAALIDAARRAWSLHLERTLIRARRLRLRGPRQLFVRGDPLALRWVLAILLVAGFAAFGNETAARVADAFQPNFSSPSAVPGTLTAWVAPPGYTALPSIPLEASPGGVDGTVVRVPDGSVLLVRVHGGSGESAAEMAARAQLSFVQLDAANAALEVPIDAGGPVMVRQGSEILAHWVFEVIPDEAPEALFAHPPSGTARGSLQLDVAASDDYGVRSLETVIRWRGEAATVAEKPIRLELPVSSRRAREIEHVTYHDLASHIWAGEPVEMELAATDARGQTGIDTVETRLPARRFDHPIAATIITERKKFAYEQAPRRLVGHNLKALADAGSTYGDVPRVRDALVEAANLVSGEPAQDTRRRAIDLLWEAAVWVEEGTFAQADAAFRDAQDQLAEALRQDSRPEALEQLLSDLGENLMDYLEEMDESFAPPDQDEESGASVPGGVDADQNATRRELQDKVDEIVDLATTGAPEEAEDALDDLRDITENMERAGERMLAESDQRLDQRQAMMQQMQEMMEQQEQLMEQSFYQSARAGVADQKSPGSGSFDPPEDRQNRLRRELGEMMRRLGEEGEEIPSELGEAEQAMRQAAQELQRSRPGQASEAQGKAIDLLRLGYEQVRPMPGGLGPSQVAGERPGEHNRQSRDPLGRVPPGDGASPSGDVGIPKKLERRRAREIVEELRLRAGDATRPELDREYATRLLDWY